MKHREQLGKGDVGSKNAMASLRQSRHVILTVQVHAVWENHLDKEGVGVHPRPRPGDPHANQPSKGGDVAKNSKGGDVAWLYK